MIFTWDEAKAVTNIEKHGVSFDIAMRVFLDDNRLVIPDTRFDYGEERFITIGAIERRTHVVVYTETIDNTRIISARKANNRETAAYENR